MQRRKVGAENQSLFNAEITCQNQSREYYVASESLSTSIAVV